MSSGEQNGLDSRSLIWQAMGEADIHRRYYIRRRDTLRRWNTGFLVASWLTALTGAVLSVALTGEAGLQWGIPAVIVAAAITSLRDVLGLPDRIAEARSVVIMANEEYDEMRLLWETGGRHRPATELESYRRISRASNIINEPVVPKTLEKARKDSVEFHRGIEAPSHESIIAPTS